MHARGARAARRAAGVLVNHLLPCCPQPYNPTTLLSCCPAALDALLDVLQACSFATCPLEPADRARRRELLVCVETAAFRGRDLRPADRRGALAGLPRCCVRCEAARPGAGAGGGAGAQRSRPSLLSKPPAAAAAAAPAYREAQLEPNLFRALGATGAWLRGAALSLACAARACLRGGGGHAARPDSHLYYHAFAAMLACSAEKDPLFRRRQAELQAAGRSRAQGAGRRQQEKDPLFRRGQAELAAAGPLVAAGGLPPTAEGHATAMQPPHNRHVTAM